MIRPIKTNCVITSIRRKTDKSLGLSISTPEVTTEEAVAMMELQGINLTALFAPTDEPNAPLIEVDKDIEQKSISKRISNTLWVLLSKQLNRKPTNDEWTTYYNKQGEKIINSIKNKIGEYE